MGRRLGDCYKWNDSKIADPQNFGQRPSTYGLELYEIKVLPMLLNVFAVASDFVIVFMTINRFNLVWVRFNHNNALRTSDCIS